MRKKPSVYAVYNPSDGPKNQEKPLESLKSECLYMMHTQYRDKERQEHNSVEDYKKWISIIEILSQRGKIKNPDKLLKDLKNKIKKPSFFSKLFKKSS